MASKLRADATTRRRPKDSYAVNFPFRTLSWRWERAQALIDEHGLPKPFRFTDDDDVRKLRRYLLDYNRAGQDDDAKRTLFSRHPEVFTAHAIFEANDDLLREYLEARILARMDDLEIARKTAVFAEAVRAYEACFFNVRDRLDQPDWVVRTVLGSLHESDYQDSAETKSRKILGYFGGPHVLETLIHTVATEPMVDRPDEVEKYLQRQYQFNLTRRAVSVVNHFKVNSMNVMQLFELHAKTAALIEESKVKNQGADTVTSRVLELLSVPRYQVGINTHNRLEGQPASSDLRTQEILMLSCGQSPPSLEARQGSSMPEPRVTPDEKVAAGSQEPAPLER